MLRIDKKTKMWYNLTIKVRKQGRKGRILGIAVSAPGAVDVSTGVIGGKSAVSGIHGPAWIEELQKCFGLPASIENDANCAAMAEVTFGNGRDVKIWLL